MNTINISQIQFEAKSTPLENAKLLRKNFEKTNINHQYFYFFSTNTSIHTAKI